MTLSVFIINKEALIIADDLMSASEFYFNNTEVEITILEKIDIDSEYLWTSPKIFTKAYIDTGYIYPNTTVALKEKGTLALNEGHIVEYRKLSEVMEEEKGMDTPRFLS